ncbi:hypothetical protein [Cellulomonas bogoriensis]|uniref:Uncharacterized protein n=1 Tax=Cellulomonas bogoriensis 69B4 = DSM 16987 TaxID=1386082 RepID=A0A0A0C5D9_9CELL|nr:hypothetical protein [Cellulomonas bogoriensis]KGM14589.1 hypothetical protein N869_05150 [Cellulomonas bogoriensis 69B4 = DSM 16987]
MSRFHVEPGTLDLLAQLARRQADHVDAVTAYVEGATCLDGTGGLVMQVLGNQYDEARTTLLRGLREAHQVCRATEQRATESRDGYRAADRFAHDAVVAAVGDTLGEPPGWTAPVDPVLGPARSAGAFATGDGSAGGNGDAPVWGVTKELGNSVVPEVMSPSDRLYRAQHPVHSRVDAVDAWTQKYLSPREHLLGLAEDRAWEALDNRFGIPHDTSTLRERFTTIQQGRYLEGYEAGYSALRDEGAHTAPSPWVTDGAGAQIWEVARDVDRVVSAGRAVTDAVGSVQDAGAAHARAEAVADQARGPANTRSSDWAQNR